jgi:hypothetical protein
MNRKLLLAAALSCTVAVTVAVAQQASDPAGKTEPQPGVSAPNTVTKTRRATAIKIEVFEDGARATNITVPLWLVKNASRLLPKEVTEREGVDIAQIIALLENAPEDGVLLEVNDRNSRVVISVVSN